MLSGRTRRAPTLHGLLDAALPDAPLKARLHWFEDLALWLRGEASWLRRRQPSDARTLRLQALTAALRDAAPWRDRVRLLLASVLADTQAFALLCDTGTGRLGFAGEALDRVSRKLIPQAPDDHDLAELLLRMFPTEADVAWLVELPPGVLQEFAEQVATPETFASLRPAVIDTLHVLSLRVAARGFADDIRNRAGVSVRDSPFYQLAPACRGFLDEPSEATRDALESAIAGCRTAVARVFASLEDRGVSVDLVYRLELQTRNLDRMATLLALLHPHADTRPEAPAVLLLAGLLRQRQASTDLAGLVRTSSHQLARKIVERTGHTGEHYITTTSAEYRSMLRSAAGGGILTAGTAALKFAIAGAKLPIFFEMTLLACNYGGSFLLMQALGFTLATKQPSMTAAALAGQIHEAKGNAELESLVDLIARITRSQLAAVIGNIGCVVPACFALDLAFRQLSGHAYLDASTAAYVLHSLDPWESMTIPFAMLTGFLLWLGSIVAGWLENWAVYRRLPQAIARNRTLVALLGAARTRHLARTFSHNVSGVGGNAALGVLLGMPPGIGRFFGIPLDVRHITLSTGALTLAICTLGPAHLMLDSGRAALLGLGIVALLNFGVSFLLALMVALRARDIHNEAQIFPAILKGLWRAPRRFVLPPRDAGVGVGTQS